MSSQRKPNINSDARSWVLTITEDGRPVLKLFRTEAEAAEFSRKLRLRLTREAQNTGKH